MVSWFHRLIPLSAENICWIVYLLETYKSYRHSSMMSLLTCKDASYVFFLPLLESPTAPCYPKVVLPTQGAQLWACWWQVYGQKRGYQDTTCSLVLWVYTKEPWWGRSTTEAGVSQRTRERWVPNCTIDSLKSPWTCMVALLPSG